MRLTLNLILLIAVLFSPPASASDEILRGIVNHVSDGDTMRVGGVTVRLWRRSGGRSEGAGPGTRGRLRDGRSGPLRTVARCRVGGRDLGRLLVDGGLAVDYERYSGGFYAAAEASARGRRAGVWAGEFQRPEDWRRSRRTSE